LTRLSMPFLNGKMHWKSSNMVAESEWRLILERLSRLEAETRRLGSALLDQEVEISELKEMTSAKSFRSERARGPEGTS
jgi:hypothetical protein